MSNAILSLEQKETLLKTLKARFDKNMNRHLGLEWTKVLERLEANPNKLFAVSEMERTGGEPDVIFKDNKSTEYTFYDCSPESPTGRRSLCFDKVAWESRKENKPQGSALEMAEKMGVEMLSEEEYKFLQTFGKFDTKTSSWVKTPQAIRKHGGALFCDCRYEHIFTYHNGAESYYAARGFRGLIKV